MKYYVYINGTLEDFDTKSGALNFIKDLLDEYDISEFILIEGRELKVSYKVEAN